MFSGLNFRKATATTLNPLPVNSSNCCCKPEAVLEVIILVLFFLWTFEHRFITFSGAPETYKRFQFPDLCKAAINLSWVLKGISSIFGSCFSNWGFFKPCLAAAITRALSVGLPLIFHFLKPSLGFSTKASLAKAPICKARFWLSLLTSITSILPSVKVRVLSVAIIEVEPRVSAEANFLTKPLLLKILSIPKAKITVIAIGRPSGIAATATATVVVKISLNLSTNEISLNLNIPSINIPRQITAIAKATIFEKWDSFFW